LFFGYEYKPVKSTEEKEQEKADAKRPHFAGQGQSLRGTVKRKGETDEKSKAPDKKSPSEGGHRLDGRGPK
jgi:ubiquitin fusion degradation protein 1